MSDNNGSPELHGEQGADSQDGNSAQGLTAEDVARILDARLNDFASSTLNKAVSSHVKRAMNALAPSEPKSRQRSEEDDDGDDADGASEKSGRYSTQDSAEKGPTVAERRWEAKLAKLEKQLQSEREKREEEAAARAQSERDSTLRRVIEKAGVRDVEAVFRFVKPDLKVGEDGTYYAETDDGVLDPSDYLASLIKSNDWMQPVSNKGGGKAPQDRAAPTGGGAQRMTESAFLDAIEKATASGDMAKHRALMDAFDAGKIVVEG